MNRLLLSAVIGMGLLASACVTENAAIPGRPHLNNFCEALEVGVDVIPPMSYDKCVDLSYELISDAEYQKLYDGCNDPDKLAIFNSKGTKPKSAEDCEYSFLAAIYMKSKDDKYCNVEAIPYFEAVFLSYGDSIAESDYTSCMLGGVDPNRRYENLICQAMVQSESINVMSYDICIQRSHSYMTDDTYKKHVNNCLDKNKVASLSSTLGPNTPLTPGVNCMTAVESTYFASAPECKSEVEAFLDAAFTSPVAKDDPAFVQLNLCNGLNR